MVNTNILQKNYHNDKNLKVFVNGTEDNLDSAVKKAINQNMTSSDKKKVDDGGTFETILIFSEQNKKLIF